MLAHSIPEGGETHYKGIRYNRPYFYSCVFCRATRASFHAFCPGECGACEIRRSHDTMDATGIIGSVQCLDCRELTVPGNIIPWCIYCARKPRASLASVPTNLRSLYGASNV